jgi:hypothetical protein
LREPIETRFARYVNKDEAGGCWLWTGYTVRGYGALGIKGRPIYAHRISWELHRGQIADGSCVLHHCDVPRCVNPDHLFLGSRQDNLTDARQKGRLDESRPRVRVLTPHERLTIFNARRYRGVCVALAKQYGVTKACITTIRKGLFVRPVLQRVPHINLSVRGEVA